MNHLDFVIWMIFYPAVDSVVEILRHKYGERREPSDIQIRGIAALIQMFIWAFVGYQLF